jgi:hypothetical protein
MVQGKYFVLRVIVQKAIHWNQITNKIHHIVIVGTVLSRIEKSYRDRGKIDSPNTHYVNGVLCKMLLRVDIVKWPFHLLFYLKQIKNTHILRACLYLFCSFIQDLLADQYKI